MKLVPVQKKGLPKDIVRLDETSKFVAEMFSTFLSHLTGDPIGPICEDLTTLIWNKYLRTQTDPKRMN